jgi:hypothetical protein
MANSTPVYFQNPFYRALPSGTEIATHNPTYSSFYKDELSLSSRSNQDIFMKLSFVFRYALLLLLIVALKPSATQAQLQNTQVSSGDAYISWDGTNWTLSSGMIEKRLTFLNGTFQCTSIINKLTNREYIQAGQSNPEFQTIFNGQTYSGTTGGWTLADQRFYVGYQDALYLDITLTNAAGLRVILHYINFPNVGTIKHQVEFRNQSGATRNFADPSIFTYRIMANDVNNLNLHYMTGGGNFAGSNMLKTVPLSSTYSRLFDSYDAPEWMTVDNDSSSGVGLKRYQGTTVYNEFFVLRNRLSTEGLWLTFDYMGHWKTRVGNSSGTNINLWGTLGGINIPVANGDGFTTGYHTIGTFSGGDLDDMGNTILKYVYTYQWDYYREWTQRAGTWAFLLPSQGAPTSYANPIYAMQQATRAYGGGVFQVDQFGTNLAGDWENVGTTINYDHVTEWARRGNLFMKLWMPPWHAEDGSWVKTNRPQWQPVGDQKDWCGWHIDVGNPDAYNWMLSMLQNRADRWGPYQIRLDGEPAFPSAGSDNSMIRQSENFYKLLKEIKDTRQGVAIENCSGGGQNYTMEAVRFSDGQQLTDGNSHHYTGYWNMLVIPPAKAQAWFGIAPGRDNNFNNGQQKSASMQELVKSTNDFGHYTWSQGIMKRWTKVYRPTVQNLDQTFVIQYMTGDNMKGVVYTSSYCPYFNQTIKLFPKGLIDDQLYLVKGRLGGTTPQTQTGAYWKANGITYLNAPGEVITFNLANFPGSRTDITPPSAPSNLTKNSATWMGRNGVELDWTPGTDNNWVSAHEIFVNGTFYTKQMFGPNSKGYTFIENGALNANYQIRTVDGDGNVSQLISVNQTIPGPTPVPSPTPAQGSRVNAALSSNGAIATASSTHSSGFNVTNVINGERAGRVWGSNGGWNDATNGAFPDWVQINLASPVPVDEINLFGVQDNYQSPVEPTETMTSTKYGLVSFQIQYWNGSNWMTVPNGSISSNNRVWRKITFPAINTDKIRVSINSTMDQWSRITEVEAWYTVGGTPAPTPTPTPTPTPNPTPVDEVTRVNAALAQNGAVASASSTHSAGYAPSNVINGERAGTNWGQKGGWNDATNAIFPDWIQVDFPTAQPIDEINLFGLQDNYQSPVTPTESMISTKYTLINLQIQYWNGSGWITVPNGAITGNDRVWRKVTFSPINTNRIRVLISSTRDQWSRVTEIEAWYSASTTPRLNFAAAANGGTATASSTHSSGYQASNTINGDRSGTNWGSTGGWNDGTNSLFPDWLQVNFIGTRFIDEINIFGVQDTYQSPVAPTESMVSTKYTLINFQVQYWDGTNWITVPNGTVTGNTRVWKRITFPVVSTDRIRVYITGTQDNWTRISEVEAWGTE